MRFQFEAVRAPPIDKGAPIELNAALARVFAAVALRPIPPYLKDLADQLELAHPARIIPGRNRP